MLCQEGNLAAVMWMITVGANPRDCCDRGHNALMHALVMGPRGPQMHVVIFLTPFLTAGGGGVPLGIAYGEDDYDEVD
jgi:hypothetical protein